MTSRFDEIYASNQWKYGSGEGSRTIHTKGYINFLNTFLRDRSVTSVVDMGCGDWQFSRYVDWGDIAYKGYDVVESVITANQKAYQQSNIQFLIYSGDPNELPAADLLIVKDVLQHLSDKTIQMFLPNVKKYKYTLITNCVNPKGPTISEDTEDGGFRYLDLRLPPYNLQATEVYAFSKKENPIKLLYRKPRWKKKVLLVENM